MQPSIEIKIHLNFDDDRVIFFITGNITEVDGLNEVCETLKRVSPKSMQSMSIITVMV